jgi:hypothetical protein
MSVMDDIVEDVYRGAIAIERFLDAADGALDTGTEAAGFGKYDSHGSCSLSREAAFQEQKVCSKLLTETPAVG